MEYLTGFQRDLLYVIAGSDQLSGQGVGSELAGYYEREPTHGRLYPNLNTLVEHGLAEKGQHNRRTNYYALTDAGRAAIRERREWENQYLDE